MAILALNVDKSNSFGSIYAPVRIKYQAKHVSDNTSRTVVVKGGGNVISPAITHLQQHRKCRNSTVTFRPDNSLEYPGSVRMVRCETNTPCKSGLT